MARETTTTAVHFTLADGRPGVTHRVEHSPFKAARWGMETRCGRRLPLAADRGAAWGEGSRPCKSCEA